MCRRKWKALCVYVDWGKRQAEGKRVAPCQNNCLHSNHCPQGGSELGLNGVGYLYITTSSLAICFSIPKDSCLSADTYFDMNRCACPQPAAFLGQWRKIYSSVCSVDMMPSLGLGDWPALSPMPLLSPMGCTLEITCLEPPMGTRGILAYKYAAQYNNQEEYLAICTVRPWIQDKHPQKTKSSIQNFLPGICKLSHR